MAKLVHIVGIMASFDLYVFGEIDDQGKVLKCTLIYTAHAIVHKVSKTEEILKSKSSITKKGVLQARKCGRHDWSLNLSRPDLLYQ